MRLIFYLSLLSLLLIVVACGSPEKQQRPEQTDEHEQQSETLGVRTINIVGIDKMKYVVKESSEGVETGEGVEIYDGSRYLLLENIKASPGQKLHIRLTAISNLPPKSMSHNWILLNRDADPASFAKAALQADPKTRIPEKYKDQIIAYTDLAAGGETVEVTFTAPEQTGKYDYLCSFPAHYTSGITGKLIVQ